MSTFSLSSTIKHYPDFPYEDIKRKILGAKYELSLVFVGKKKAAALNATYRHKSYIPNVLSFPLSHNTGEIIICPHVARSQAAAYNLSSEGYVAFLFIHGCLHLKGLDHRDTMDTQEQKYLTYFNIS